MKHFKLMEPVKLKVTIIQKERPERSVGFSFEEGTTKEYLIEQGHNLILMSARKLQVEKVFA